MVNLFSYILVIVMGVLGVICIRQGRKALQGSSLLRRQGVVVEGHITGRHSGNVGRGAVWYYLTYSYEYNGKSYLQEQPVSQKYYAARDIGTAVPVRCLPSNPAVATLLEDNFAGTAAIGYVIGGYVLIGMAIFALVIILTVLLCNCPAKM